MAENLKTMLAQAYHSAQVKGDRAGAVADLRAALSVDLKLHAAARAELNRLGAFMASIRGQGRGGCHISKVTHDLLTSALG